MLPNMFLKIDGIDGESANDKHKGEIDILSYSLGGTQAGTFATGGGGGAGKVHLGDMSLVKKVDKSSPKLFQALCTGQHIKTAVLSINKAGGDQEEYFKVTLSDVLVSHYSTSGSHGEAIPTESVSLNFSKIEFEYKEQKASGQVGGAVKAGYDVKSGKKV